MRRFQLQQRLDGRAVGYPAHQHHIRQRFDHLQTSQTPRHPQRQTLPLVLVDHHQDAQRPSIVRHRLHEIMDRVQRIWRREGLKVPQKQRPRGRLWLGDGSCVRLRPERANHVGPCGRPSAPRNIDCAFGGYQDSIRWLGDFWHYAFSIGHAFQHHQRRQRKRYFGSGQCWSS